MTASSLSSWFPLAAVVTRVCVCVCVCVCVRVQVTGKKIFVHIKMLMHEAQSVSVQVRTGCLCVWGSLNAHARVHRWCLCDLSSGVLSLLPPSLLVLETLLALGVVVV